MLVSLCGTPGTGKTTAGEILARSGIEVISLGGLIKDLGLSEGNDPASGSDIVDVDNLRDALEDWAVQIGRHTVLEGHLSYLAPSDLCLMLRVDPDRVMSRLRTRDYPDAKSHENAEAEGVGTLLTWAMAEEETRLGGRSWEDLPLGCGIVMEKDVSGETPEEVAGWVRLMMDAFLGKGLSGLRPYRPGKVDWLEVLSGWY
jgi:broad-specificity NMP kinase